MAMFPEDSGVDARWPLRVLVRIGVAVLSTIVMTLVGGLFGFIGSAVVWGVLLARPAIELSGYLHFAARRRALGPWSGRYLEYQGRHLRAYWVREHLWLVDRDVLAVLGRKPSPALHERFDALAYDRIEGTRHQGFSEDGLRLLLAEDVDPAARALWRWLEREVLLPAQRRRERERLERRIP